MACNKIATKTVVVNMQRILIWKKIISRDAFVPALAIGVGRVIETITSFVSMSTEVRKS